MMRPLFYGLIKHDFFLLPSQQGLDSWELAACTCVVTGPFLVSVFFSLSPLEWRAYVILVAKFRKRIRTLFSMLYLSRDEIKRNLGYLGQSFMHQSHKKKSLAQFNCLLVNSGEFSKPRKFKWVW